MNTERLVATLHELTPQATDHESLAIYNPASTEYRLNRDKAVRAGPVIDKLAQVLAEEAELHVFHQMALRTSPTSSWTGQLFHLARWMLAQARQRDAAEVLRRLEEFIATNAADALEVMPLWGLHPTREIALVHDIRLVPFVEVPSTVPKDMLTGVHSSRYEDKNAFAWAPRPKAALVRSFRHGPIFNPNADGDSRWVERFPNHADVQDDQMREIARVLMLVRCSPVFPIAHWFQIPEETPLIGSVGGWGGYEYDRRFIEEIRPADYDPLAVQDLVSRYLRLTNGVRRRLDVPLERLRLALLRVRPQDIALELGIALESLLTKEQDSEAPISYRLRLRATHLLGGESEERRENANRFRIVYRLRSRAAHGASVTDAALKDAGGAGPVVEFLRECANCSAEMIRRIICNGDFPDWEGLAMGWADRPR